MAKVRVAPNPQGMRELLQSEAVGQHLEALLRARAGADVEVSRQAGKTRQNVRAEYASGRNGLDREAKTGTLRRLLG